MTIPVVHHNIKNVKKVNAKPETQIYISIYFF